MTRPQSDDGGGENTVSNANREPGSDDGVLDERTQMLIETRGYQELKTQSTETQTDSVVFDPRTEEKVSIRVLTTSESYAGLPQIREMAKVMDEGESPRGILIAEKRSSSHAVRNVAQRNRIKIFTTKTLPFFDVLAHELVPKHELISENEAKQVLRQYRLKPHQLPHIKASDPPIRLLGGKEGDLVKITRESPTAGRTISYRYVVR